MFFLRPFFLSTLCAFSFSLHAYEAAPFTYLCWDNQTEASEADLVADPLLVLRTAKRYKNHEESQVENYQKVGLLNSLILQPHHSRDKDTESERITNDTYIASNSPKVINATNDFIETKISFDIASDTYKDKVLWQISTTPDFSSIPSTLERVAAFSPTITLSDLDETFLNNETGYYFRIQAKGPNGRSSSFSEPFAFTVKKPHQVTNLHSENNTLVWDSENEKGSYLVFGSNSVDFVPNIYSSNQPEVILQNIIVSASPSNNFLGETEKSEFPITERFAYYRVIAKVNNSLSIPSELFAINDHLPPPERDALLCDLTNPSLLFREKLPEGYSWLQKKVAKNDLIATQYVKNPYVDEDLWNTLSPYFLPEHFPEKAILDRIFNQRRVLSSVKSMVKSGFILLTNPNDKIVVAKHVNLKGYVIKAYTDDMPYADWFWWKKRIDGIRVIQAKIVQNGYQGIMKAPQKWIYPVPPEPSPKKDAALPKNFILIAQDMDILDYKKNRKAYKNKMTPQILDAFYIMLTDLLLIDSVYADNTPFSKDGRLAFIDTEHSLDTTMPVPISVVAQYLSTDMYKYWEYLISIGGPRR